MLLLEKRSGIARFEGPNKFNDVELVQVLQALAPYIRDGSIDLDAIDNVTVTEKLDSSYAGFGMTHDGKFFLESSNSGEVTANDYKQKFGPMVDFTASFESLYNNKRLQNVLRKIFNKVGAVKFEAEIFPTLTHQGDENGDVIFVATKYDKSKLGEDGAFMVFRALVDDGDGGFKNTDKNQNRKLVEALKMADSSKWRIYYIESEGKLNGKIQFDFSGLEDYLANPQKLKTAEKILQDRRNSVEKANLKNILDALRPRLQSVLDKYANEVNSALGKGRSPVEGVVMAIRKPDGEIFHVKGTSEIFQDFKKKTWATRSLVIELEKTIQEKILKEALGLRTSQPAALNRAIKKVADGFEGNLDDFIATLLEELQDKDPKPGLANVIVDESVKVLDQIKQEFEESKGKIDPDSVAKSVESIERLEAKIEDIKNQVAGASDPVELAKAILKGRIEKNVGDQFNESMMTEDDGPLAGLTPVILWNGRAQPWHKGHDSLIQEGKNKLKMSGAQRVLIVLVKGGKSAADKKSNPLDLEEQIDLLHAIYDNDPQVIVSDVPANTGFITDLLKVAVANDAYATGWLAGSDRIPSYKGMFQKFQQNPKWQAELEDLGFMPLETDDNGVPQIDFLELKRDENAGSGGDFEDMVRAAESSDGPAIPKELMSGSLSRKLATAVPFEIWYKELVPPLYADQESTIKAYRFVYNRLNEILGAAKAEESEHIISMRNNLHNSLFGRIEEAEPEAKPEGEGSFDKGKIAAKAVGKTAKKGLLGALKGAGVLSTALVATKYPRIAGLTALAYNSVSGMVDDLRNNFKEGKLNAQKLNQKAAEISKKTKNKYDALKEIAATMPDKFGEGANKLGIKSPVTDEKSFLVYVDEQKDKIDVMKLRQQYETGSPPKNEDLGAILKKLAKESVIYEAEEDSPEEPVGKEEVAKAIDEAPPEELKKAFLEAMKSTIEKYIAMEDDIMSAISGAAQLLQEIKGEVDAKNLQKMTGIDDKEFLKRWYDTKVKTDPSLKGELTIKNVG
jgi:hypothetical protein